MREAPGRVGRFLRICAFLLFAIGLPLTIVVALGVVILTLAESVPSAAAHLISLDLGPEPAWVWLLDLALAVGAAILLAVAPYLLRVLLISSGILGLLGLLIAWTPEVHWLPTLLREQALELRHYLSQLSMVRELTLGWDWERLRTAATLWVVVEGLGLWSVRNVSIPIVTAAPAVGLIGLAFFQYSTVGGGQPVWAIEHVVVHLLQLADLKEADIEAFRSLAREHFAGREHHDLSLQSQELLFALAFTLSFGIRWLLSLADSG